jgi:CDP-6-deoxy-D-xylo-4-hexulose-3-dehydrase
MFWPLQENILEKKDSEELVEFIRSTDRFTQFVKVREFEAAWSKWQGCKYSVYVNSGSSANLIMISLMKQRGGWKDGDEVIVPTVTWVTNISPIFQCGLKPVFVDVNLQDFSFDYDSLEAKITPKTRAIFVTHLIGFPADIARIKKIIGDRKIEILEDCCESHGAMVGDTKIGNLGVCSSFSFYWGHHMTTVEGGMI